MTDKEIIFELEFVKTQMINAYTRKVYDSNNCTTQILSKKKADDIIKECRANIDNLIKILSNERETVRKHEGKKRICPNCNGKGKYYHITYDDDVNCCTCNGTGQI